MLTLTSQIVLRITKLRVTGVDGLDALDDGTEATIKIEAGNATGVVETHLVSVRDGACLGLGESNSRLGRVKFTVPTGLTDLRAAVAAASGRAAKIQAVETWLLSVGMLPAGTIT